MNHAGAIASNAGDDFHLIWAGKKVIELLKPGSDLEAVVVEGPALEDSTVINDQSMLYSIDMTEYYGGRSMHTANKVVFSQFKYSAYLPEKEWNLTRICASSDEKQSNSVIRRMADTYKGFSEQYIDTSEKIVLKLVSNQALAQDITESIKECKEILNKKMYKQTAALINRLDESHKKIVNRIYKISGLLSEQFIGFMRVLDFEDCGTNVRHLHEMEVMRQLGIWGFNNNKSSYNNLIMEIRRCMLPEGKDTIINRNWLKAVLEIEEKSIFPAPSRVEQLNGEYITKDGEEDIVKQFLTSKKIWTCFYGTAGAGKTTFVANIEKYLPEESITVLYDCYGGGAFFQPDLPRHKKEIAIRQICNMLALKCKTELFVGNPHEDYLWWSALKDRLNQASSLIHEKNPEAVIVLIIDAVDNSMFVANTMRHECFLQELLKLQLPENVRIVATARTERMELLPKIEMAQKLEIPLFNKENSFKYLKSVFPEVTEEIGEEFHELTNGNPRLQNYVLTNTSDLNGVLDCVRPDGKSLEDVFDNYIETIKIQYNDICEIGLLFFSVSRMIRPIPNKIICEICGISFALLNSVCVECHYGLYSKNEQLSFKDEDFENYIYLKFSDNKNYMSKIADYLYEKRNENAYCARYVHLFLDEADQFERIIQISLNEEIDGTSVGLAQTNKIMIERIHAALARPEMKKRGNRVLAYKLIYRMADFCAGEDSLSKLLYDAPEEVSIFGDEMSVRAVIASFDNSFEALGRNALLSAGLSDGKERARDFINIFVHKLNAYCKNQNEDRRVDRPRKDDIVRIIEAMLMCSDIDRAYWLLTGWKPEKAAIPYISSFFKKALIYRNETDIDSLLKRKWSLPNLLSIICAYIAAGKTVPTIFSDRVDKAFDRIKILPLKRFSFENIIQYFEYKSIADNELNRVSTWLDKIGIKPTISPNMSFWDDERGRQLDLCFRYYALLCVCRNIDVHVEDYYIKENVEKKKKWYEKDSKLERFKFLYRFYLFRMKVSKYKADNIENFINDNYYKLNQYRYYVSMDIENQYIYEKAGLLFLESISCLECISDKTCHRYVKKLLEIDSWRREFYLRAIDIFSKYKKMHNDCFFVLKKIDYIMTESPEYAEGMVNTYLHCTRAAVKIKQSIGKEYFRKAIASTRQANTYSYRKIELFHDVIYNCEDDRNHDKELMAYKFAGICENYLRTLDDTKNFPYEKALAACTLLGKKGIWSTLCRMDDRDEYNWIAIEDTLSFVLCSMLDKKKLDVWQIIALSIILLPENSNDYFKVMQQELNHLDKIELDKKQNCLKIIIDDILYNVPMQEKKRFLDCIIEYIDRNPKDPELDVREVEDMNKFFDILDRKVSKYEDSNLPSMNTRDKYLIDFLNVLQNDDCVPEIENTLNHMIQGDGKYSIYQLNYIADFVEEKAYLMNIDNWRRNFNIRRNYFIKLTPRLISNYWDKTIYTQTNRIFEYTQDEKFIFMIESLNQNYIFSADEYIQAMTLIAECLDAQEAMHLLEWMIEIEWNKCCMSYSGSAPEFLGIVNDNTKNEKIDYYIAMFLWRMFGHPDKKKRFKAMHALWRYLTFENSILSYFYEIYEKNDFSELYLDKGNYFFNESAQISFLEASLYIAEHTPLILIKYYKFYENIAFLNSIQHALKRHLALDICKKLKYASGDTEMAFLDECEKCICTTNVKGIRNYERERDGNQVFCFHIDNMDTTRYWYDDVAEIFGCTQGEVAEICDYYITNKLKITNMMAETWQKKYFHQQNYGRASNSHGSIPSYEVLRKYAEWHSMFYAADYLRRSKSIVDDEDINYSLWLDRFVPGLNDVWTYEMRCYPPLQSLFWEPDFLPGRKGEEGYVIPDNFVDMLMGETRDIILNLDCCNTYNRCRKYVSIVSVVIENKGIDYFIMQSKNDSNIIYDFLYREDEDWENNQKVFVKSTCVDKKAFSERASDMKDPLSKGHLELQNYFNCLSTEVFKDFREPDFKELCPRADTTDKFLFRKWCEPETENGYDKMGTYGHLVSVDKDYILSVLQENLWTLACKITVEVGDEYSSYELEREEVKQEFLWLMKADGSTEIVNLKKS